MPERILVPSMRCLFGAWLSFAVLVATVAAQNATEKDAAKAPTNLFENQIGGVPRTKDVATANSADAGSLSVRIEAFLTEDYLNVTVKPPAPFPAGKTEIRLAVSASTGPVIEERALTDAKTGEATFRLAGSRIADGKIAVEATAAEPGGRQLAARRELDRPLRPTWRGTKVGLSDSVPSPWTPIEVQGDTVKPWGRTYRFERSVLPTEVVTRAASVLTRPITLRGRCEGKPIAWQGDPIAWNERKPGVVSLTGSAVSEGLAFSGATAVEYDGMIRVDLRLTPQHARATIDELILEMPLKPEHAKYLYHFPGRWGSVANSGFVPAAGWAHAFKPFVWLGDEDRGLAWFCESDEHWQPAQADRALTVDRDSDAVVLRCHLVERPMVIDRALTYTFGFQATPVKDPPKTAWDYRITHHGNYGLERQPGGSAGLTYPAAGHLRAESGTFECWYRPAFDTERQTPMPERKHKENRDLLTIKWGDDIARGTNCGLYWNAHEQGLVAWSRKDGKVLFGLTAPFDWKAGQWHHLAVSWGDHVRIAVDGKIVTERACASWIPGPVEQATLVIGGRNTAATLDQVRISSVARPSRLPTGPDARDGRTLLLNPWESEAAGQNDASLRVRVIDAKFGKGPTWEPDFVPTRLEWLASMGVRTVCFHEHWSPYQSYPDVTEENRPQLRSLVDGCHRAKVNLLLYMSRQFSDNAPEWELYSKEVIEQPNFGIYHRQPSQKAYCVCWKSAWKEFCLEHLDRLLAEFGHDGWYLDGPEWPMACSNRHHGCGYFGADGKVHNTYDIFATRDFMKRLYVLTRARKPDGQLNIHNSTVMVIPTLAWGTSSWGGEQLDAIKPPAKTLDILPLDAFRTEFMGRQWGVPSEFLVYDGMPYHAKDLLAYTLLHGVLIRPSSDQQIAEIAALWKVYDTFPFHHAAYHPYWANADVLTCGPQGVYATAYERPGAAGPSRPFVGRFLVLVSNLTDRAEEATVTLQRRVKDGPGEPRVEDALTGQPLSCTSGKVGLPIGPWEYRVLRIH